MFIALEGIDGCGKTTAAEYIKKYLEDKQYEVVAVSPVRDNTVGKIVREMLMSHTFVPLNPDIKLMLMASSHECCLDEVVLPALAEGKTVVMDRYFPSMLAYQGDGTLAEACANVLQSKLPLDVVFFLDINIDETYKRMESRGYELEDMESVSRNEFETRARRYRDIFRVYKAKRMVLIDANQGLDDVKKQITKALDTLTK